LKISLLRKDYSKVPLSENEIKQLATYINSQFYKTRYSDLSGVTEFMRIITDFTKNKDSIHVNMQFLNWCIRLAEKTEFRHSVKLSNNVNHKFLFCLYNGVDYKAMQRKFSSIFIHGFDAHIVYYLLDLILQLNNKFKQHGIPLIYVSTTHDCFKINTLYADLLIPLLQEAYNSINKQEKRLKIPGLLSKNKKSIYVTNPNFIRH
jgi:hypothetical protein